MSSLADDAYKVAAKLNADGRIAEAYMITLLKDIRDKLYGDAPSQLTHALTQLESTEKPTFKPAPTPLYQKLTEALKEHTQDIYYDNTPADGSILVKPKGILGKTKFNHIHGILMDNFKVTYEPYDKQSKTKGWWKVTPK